jgi:hypothetical protein
VNRWLKETWPALKKARRQKAWIFFQDESGVSQRPSIRRTWAPRGETPVPVHAFNWKKMSLSAALGYRWDGTRARLFFQTCPDSHARFDNVLLSSFRQSFQQLSVRRSANLPGEYFRVTHDSASGRRATFPEPLLHPI